MTQKMLRVFAGGLIGLWLFAQDLPRAETVEPMTATKGTEIVVKGANLQKDAVEKLYLFVGSTEIEVTIVEQQADTIKFKVPDSVKPGRYGLLTLTGGKAPKYIEQPVRLTVE